MFIFGSSVVEFSVHSLKGPKSDDTVGGTGRRAAPLDTSRKQAGCREELGREIDSSSLSSVARLLRPDPVPHGKPHNPITLQNPTYERMRFLGRPQDINQNRELPVQTQDCQVFIHLICVAYILAFSPTEDSDCWKWNRITQV